MNTCRNRSPESLEEVRDSRVESGMNSSIVIEDTQKLIIDNLIHDRSILKSPAASMNLVFECTDSPSSLDNLLETPSFPESHYDL